MFTWIQIDLVSADLDSDSVGVYLDIGLASVDLDIDSASV